MQLGYRDIVSPSTSGPPPISPDDKDWTWVLDAVCSECGFDTSDVTAGEVASRLRTCAHEWDLLLTGGHDVRIRRRPDHWSILEYGCHVRDVCRLYLERLNLMLEQDGPDFPNWDQDQTAIDQRYDLSEPDEVSRELAEAAEQLADRFDTVHDAQWKRTGFRSDGASFTIDTFARYFIHDPVHHLHDVR